MKWCVTVCLNDYQIRMFEQQLHHSENKFNTTWYDMLFGILSNPNVKIREYVVELCQPTESSSTWNKFGSDSFH